MRRRLHRVHPHPSTLPARCYAKHCVRGVVVDDGDVPDMLSDRGRPRTASSQDYTSGLPLQVRISFNPEGYATRRQDDLPFRAHRRHLDGPSTAADSLFSIASVSSYGHVTNPGIDDPFEYELPMPSLQERPSSQGLSVSMSINVDDTFSFLGCGTPRKRVDNDASSFYIKAPAQTASTAQ
ncbi:hypothetical protein DFH09DRAFT_1372801 [Mycena vulgaris]|nr:hypothetical protein DFH09DRAFT_1372801 [Mycena vulgaris]